MIKVSVPFFTARFLISIGSWTAYIAIAITIKDVVGASAVPWVFIAMNLPSILFAQRISILINGVQIKTALVLAALVHTILLAFVSFLPYPTISIIYTFLVAIVACVSNPLSLEAIQRFFPSDLRTHAHLAMTSIQQASVSIAPYLAGEWLQKFGVGDILIISTFLVGLSAGCYACVEDKASPRWESKIIKKISFFDQFHISPQTLCNSEVLLVLGSLTLVTAILNGYEYAVFEKRLYSPAEIGATISFWGMGSLLSFFMTIRKGKSFSLFLLSILLLASMVLFCYIESFAAGDLAFFIGGYVVSEITGRSRALIQHQPSNGEENIWVFLFRVTGLLQVIIYVVCSVVIWIGVSTVLGWVLIVACCLLVALTKKVCQS